MGTPFIGRGTTLVVEGYVIVLIYVLQPANTINKKTAITAVLNIIVCPLSCGNKSSFRRQAPKDG